MELTLEEMGALDRLNAIRYAGYMRNLKKRVIVFNEEIDEETIDLVALPLMEFDKDDSQDPVTLILHSPGGSVCDGLFLVNIIDNYSKPLNIYVCGYACSMATILLCAGNKNPNVTKYAYQFTYGLIHAGSAGLFGEANVVKDTYDFQNKMNEMVNDYMVANTHITKDELIRQDRRQWFLTANEMKEKGLVDVIL